MKNVLILAGLMLSLAAAPVAAQRAGAPSRQGTVERGTGSRQAPPPERIRDQSRDRNRDQAGDPIRDRERDRDRDRDRDRSGAPPARP